MEYLLILTLITNNGYGIRTNMETVNMQTETICNRVGERWIEDLNNKHSDVLNPKHSFYMCIPLYN